MSQIDYEAVAITLRDQLHVAHKRERKLLTGLCGMLHEPPISADEVRHVLMVALFGGETWRDDDLDTFTALREMIAVHGLPERGESLCTEVPS